MKSSPAPSGPPPTGGVDRRLGGRVWAALLVIGLVGQIAWTVENMYLNVFVYERITQDPTIIALMVSLSAIAATVATLIVGAWSDRMGKRRAFVAVGYVVWGACTAAFGLLSPEEGVVAAPYVFAAVIGIVALDCLMSMIGSGANNAAFGAWVTDVTTPRRRVAVPTRCSRHFP
ncbi:MFS transporter [Microbacterium sp. Se63.02b]|uniref:MFS transporter n=1 Tax=Microbacterium sp. Se63.02b TaxID=2709304 RepID=UPI00191D8136|nr:MFS transporter [Microbacterium sp. Se63.02b]